MTPVMRRLFQSINQSLVIGRSSLAKPVWGQPPSTVRSSQSSTTLVHPAYSSLFRAEFPALAPACEFPLQPSLEPSREIAHCPVAAGRWHTLFPPAPVLSSTARAPRRYRSFAHR